MCVYKYGMGAAKARGGTVEEVRGSTQSLDHQASPLGSNDDGPWAEAVLHRLIPVHSQNTAGLRQSQQNHFSRSLKILLNSM